MTKIIFVLDRSFSMKKSVSDTIDGFNSMIKRQQVETEGNALIEFGTGLNSVRETTRV